MRRAILTMALLLLASPAVADPLADALAACQTQWWVVADKGVPAHYADDHRAACDKIDAKWRATRDATAAARGKLVEQENQQRSKRQQQSLDEAAK